MAHVNGRPYKSFGQGARREKENSMKTNNNAGRTEGENEVHDDVEGEGEVSVKHHEDTGEYHITHADGKKHVAQNKSEMLDHLDGHFPKDKDEEGDYNESEEEQAGGEEGLGGLGNSLKSILG